MLGRDHQQCVPGQRQLGVGNRTQAGGQRASQRLRGARELVGHRLDAGAREQSHRRLSRRQAAFHRQRLPGRALLVLGEAEGELARVAERGAVDAPRPAAAHVAHHQLQGPADRQVGAVALAERVDPRVHAGQGPERPIDHHHRPAEPGRRQQAVDVELVRACGFDGGQHRRQVLRPAAGQDGVDRHLLDRALDQVRRHHRHHLAGGASGAFQHGQDPPPGGRYHGQAVAPAPRVHRLELVLQLGQLDPAGAQGLGGVAFRQLLGHPGVEGARAAAGPEVGQAGPQASDPGELLPLRAHPADRAGHRPARLDSHQRGDDLDARPPGLLEPGVVTRLDAGRKGGIILRVHREGPPGGGELLQDRHHGLAGRAIGLDECDQSVRQPHPGRVICAP